MIEYPLDASWKLVKPEKPAEKTRDLYRFAVTAKPGEPALLTVEEERTDSQHIALTNLGRRLDQVLLECKSRQRQGQGRIAGNRQAQGRIGPLDRRPQQLEQRIREIGDDQTRIRQNMAQLDRNSDVYKNYVKKFSDQEAEIETLRAQIATLADEESGIRKSLDEYMMGLDLQ